MNGYAMPHRRVFGIEASPLAKLNVRPHYSDTRFNQPKTVYLHAGETAPCERGDEAFEIAGLTYRYSDRLWQADSSKSEASTRAAEASGSPPDSAAWFSAMMSHYTGTAIEVVHVIAGVNLSNGHPYYILGYREKGASVVARSEPPSRTRRRMKRRIAP